MSDPVVIDISHHQPDPIDWDAIMDAGIVGVIMKCTEGSTYVDDKFRSRYEEAIEAGLAVSTYHFMRPGSMQTQMNHYLNTLRPRDGERVVLDHEDTGVSLSDLEWCVEYLQSDSRNLQISIYSGHVIKDQLSGGRTSIVLADTSLWLAQYGPTPSWPTGTWPQWTLWQYTDTGSIPGIKGNVDLNRFNGSDENCVLWIGPAGAVPEPEPQPEPEPLGPVIVSVQSPPGVEVQVIVNGEILVVSQ